MENPAVFENISLQQDFRERLATLSKKIKENKKDKFQQKKENMRRLVVTEGSGFDMRKIEPPVSCPIKPNIMLKGVKADSSTLFMSAMCPMKLDFYTGEG
jgi:hypothetical protein